MTEAYYTDESVTLYQGDALEVLSELDPGSVDCCVTSPPYYGLRDYGTDGQYGLEASPSEYVETMRRVFAEVRRVLADDGTLWLNIGDSYSSGTGNRNEGLNERWGNAPGQRKQEVENQGRAAVVGMPPKNMLGIPWRLAFALQDDGWTLRNAIIWNKPNAMPESVTDRLACRYEHVFLFSKSRRYWFDLDPIREPHVTADRPIVPVARGSTAWSAGAPLGQPQQGSGPHGVGRSDGGRNPGDVWAIPTQPFPGAHFAVMPTALASRCIQAGCPPRRCARCEYAPAPVAGESAGLPWYQVTCNHDAHRPGTVLDPFSGSGTSGLAAARHGRRYIGIDLSAEYLDLSLRTRLGQMALLDGEVPA